MYLAVRCYDVFWHSFAKIITVRNKVSMVLTYVELSPRNNFEMGLNVVDIFHTKGKRAGVQGEREVRSQGGDANGWLREEVVF